MLSEIDEMGKQRMDSKEHFTRQVPQAMENAILVPLMWGDERLVMIMGYDFYDQGGKCQTFPSYTSLPPLLDVRPVRIA